MQRHRWIIVTGSATAVVLAIIYGFLPKPVSVDAVQVSRGPLKVTVEEEGKTRVTDRFVVSAPVSGFMKRTDVKAGDRIQKGQTVAELGPARSNPLDPRSYAAGQTGLSSAEAALRAEEERARAAGADADYGQQNLERSRKLFDTGLISRDAIEQAEATAKRSSATLRSAEAAVQVARSEVDRARTTLRHFAADGTGTVGAALVIRAPVGGSVLKVHRESEGIVQAGEPLMDIGDPQKLEVRVEVLSTDAVRIRPGTPVLFERWGGEGVLQGRVRVVEPAGFTKISSLGVEEQRVIVIVDFTPADKDRLRLGDGYRLEASFTIWEGSGILRLPASALFRNQEGWAVFVIEKGKALKREVRVGHRTGLAAEILSGLAEGESVISHPDNSIENGTRVRTR